MSDPRTLGPWVRRFLVEHVVTERNLAHNTQLSYRDTFKLLIRFMGAKARRPAERLALDDLTPGACSSSLPTWRKAAAVPRRPATSA